MNEQERELIAACVTFCHVTTAEHLATIEATGLNPAFDESLVVRGNRKEKAVYLCPEARIEKTTNFLGERANDQKNLYVYRIGAAELAAKDCGADISWLVNLVDEEKWTVAVSLEIGSIACYEAIARDELNGPQEIVNPRYIASSGEDEP